MKKVVKENNMIAPWGNTMKYIYIYIYAYIYIQIYIGWIFRR